MSHFTAFIERGKLTHEVMGKIMQILYGICNPDHVEERMLDWRREPWGSISRILFSDISSNLAGEFRWGCGYFCVWKSSVWDSNGQRLEVFYFSIEPDTDSEAIRKETRKKASEFRRQVNRYLVKHDLRTDVADVPANGGMYEQNQVED